MTVQYEPTDPDASMRTCRLHIPPPFRGKVSDLSRV